MTQVLVLCDDYWHPAQTARAGLEPLAALGYTFDCIEHSSEWSAERMAAYSLVVLTKSNNISSTDQRPWVSAEVEAAMREYVRAGNGLLVIHSGAAGYEGTPVLRGLLGGVFSSHPPQCAVTIEPQPGHPLAAGVAPFTVHDEHYMMAFDGPADVFLSTRSEHGTQPGGWRRNEGAGRVCLLTPGHNLAVWLHPSYSSLISRALAWCGAGEEDLRSS